MRRSLALAWVVALSSCAALTAEAQTVHVIGPGREGEVVGLFAPHALGDEVRDGYRLRGVAIDRGVVRATLGRGERTATVELHHPEAAPEDAPRSASFAFVVEAPDEARVAARALVDAVRANDDGSFWRDVGTTAEARSFFTWGTSTWVSFVDGLGLLALVLGLGLLLSARLLADAPRWMIGALALVVAAGLGLRLAYAPETFLGAWPWTRTYPHTLEVARGGWLAALSGGTWFETDVTAWTNLAYAAATPLILFAHATYLLRDPRAGLAAAAALALTPQHIRYSRCEDGFVASLALTSLAFATLHAFLRDRSRLVRVLSLLALPVVLYPGYLLRPLNLAFALVYAGALLGLHGDEATGRRRAVGLAVALGVAAAAAAVFLEQSGARASTLVGPEVLLRAAEVLARPSLLVLSDPTRTPPALILAAIVGGALAWRAGERRLVAFLALWLLLFVVLHAVVVQETMQPRYHLHLLVPFLLLGALAVRHAAWDDRRVRWGAAGLAASMALAPWIHRGFIEDVDYAEQHEHAFVRAARDRVPEGCTVLEVVDDDPDAEVVSSRFARIGAYAAARPRSRFEVVPLTASSAPPSIDASCVYLYEGLACATAADMHACGALRDRLGAVVEHERRGPARLYDEANGPLRVPVVFRLSRVR